MLYVDTPAGQRWRLAELDAILDRFDTEMENAVREAKLTSTDDYRSLVAFTVGKSLLMLRSVILLSANGFPEGALALARNIYEQFVIICYFEANKRAASFQTIIDDYLIDYDIQRYKALKYVYAHSNLDSIKAEKDDIESALRDSRAKASKSTRGEYWWADANSFSALAERVAQLQDTTEQPFFYTLHSLYKRACIALHASYIGNVIRLGGNDSFWGVDSSPVLEGHGTLLYFAITSFITIVGVACRLFHIDFTPYCEQLNELALFYQKQSKNEG